MVIGCVPSLFDDNIAEHENWQANFGKRFLCKYIAIGGLEPADGVFGVRISPA
jgi:hypothetical protein